MFRSTDFSFTSSINGGGFGPDIDDDDADDVIVVVVVGAAVVVATSAGIAESLSLLSGSVTPASDDVFLPDVDCSGCSDVDGKLLLLLGVASSMVEAIGGTF